MFGAGFRGSQKFTLVCVCGVTERTPSLIRGSPKRGYSVF